MGWGQGQLPKACLEDPELQESTFASRLPTKGEPDLYTWGGGVPHRPQEKLLLLADDLWGGPLGTERRATDSPCLFFLLLGSMLFSTANTFAWVHIQKVTQRTASLCQRAT